MDCAQKNGQCSVTIKNFLFLDDGQEISAVDFLMKKCGHVVIMPDASSQGRALLYHTSCARMADVVDKIFADCLEAPQRLPHGASEMTVGELHRRGVTITYDDCRERVTSFEFVKLP